MYSVIIARNFEVNLVALAPNFERAWIKVIYIVFIKNYCPVSW